MTVLLFVVSSPEREEHAQHLSRLCARASALIDQTCLREAADVLSALQIDWSVAHASQIASRIQGLRTRIEAVAVQLLERSFVVNMTTTTASGGTAAAEAEAEASRMVAFDFRGKEGGIEEWPRRC